MGPSHHLHLVQEALHKPTQDEQLDLLTRENAAIKIQRAWRAKKHAGYLHPDFLWSDLTTHARLQIDRQGAEGEKNRPRDRWRRAVFLLGRMEDGNQMLAKTGVENADAVRKHLETQHWLELIDGKHRYGSNLKYYHRKWQESDTTENFFNWLDKGGGKDLSLPECSREQLEKERISYLSPEQRLNYLVQIDSDGRLRWARSGELVDTTAGRWKDAGGGNGIVPLTHPEPTNAQQRTSFAGPSSSRSTPGSDPGFGDEVDTAMHYYANEKLPQNRFKRILWRNFTLRGLLDRLLRKTLKRNTWIYVSDKNFNIFIGIKEPGTFQHSSFLGGGLVTSAGLISVKNGLVHTLSPLSGHYRTSIQHFRQFIRVLDERGVDMSKVKVSKAEAALWGMEHIAKFKKKKAAVMKEGKEGIADAAHGAKQRIVAPNEKIRDRTELREGRQKNTHPVNAEQGPSQ
ncbi:unnamed protein product [Somion occarium]|uniref:IQ calmodulin-binding motif protein n=1 Tax=Somion occarium TaxID=3059160 RepID=A0ABP1CKS6_9APHY